MRTVGLRGWLILALVGLSACASTTAPSGWSPKPEEAGHNPYGGWVTVRLNEGDWFNDEEGELLAIDEEELALLQGSNVVRIRRQAITRLTLNRYQPASGLIGLWGGVGSLATLSHGFLSIFSFPIWVTSGIVATHSTTAKALVRYPKDPWHELRPYARFPQGLSRDAKTLKPK